MASDHEGYMKSWSFHELSSCKQQSVSEGQDVPISEILDHGSISFGRYATESLAWEKWSVFTHNRCQEELEKFRAPGLVAQKKAYFEEYYKKIGAMKTLQAEQPDYCQAANSNSMQVTTNINFKVSQEDKKPSNVSNIPNSDSNMISNLNSSLGGTVDESEQFAEKGESYGIGCCDKSIMEGKMTLSSPTSAVKKASPLRTPSSHSSKSVQTSSHLSNMVNNNADQLKKQASVQHAKGTVASIGNKTNLDSSRSTTNNVKQLAKPNPTLHQKSIHKDDKSRLTRKNNDPKAASNGNRTSSAVPNSSLVRDKLVSPLSSSRAPQVTTNTTFKSLAEKIRTTSSVHAQSAKLVSSSSTIRTCHLKKTSTASQGIEKSTTRLPVHCPSAKSTSEKTIVAGSLRNTALSRRSVDLSMQKKSNQKSGVESGQKSYVKEGMIARSVDLSMQQKSNQKSGVESGQKSYVKEGMHKEGKDKLSATIGREPKAALSARVKKDSTLVGEPMAAALSDRLKKDLNAALQSKPTAASSAKLKKDSNAAITKEPKAALAQRLRKDSNAALGQAPTVASSTGLRTDSKRVSSKMFNVPNAQSAMLTQKIVPCRSPDLLHDQREPTRPRPRPIWR